jgi:hypothetical protein
MPSAKRFNKPLISLEKDQAAQKRCSQQDVAIYPAKKIFAKPAQR